MMNKITTTVLLALAAGGLLTCMVTANSTLAASTSPLIAAWFAHGTGALVASLLFLVFRQSHSPSITGQPPIWSYLGGIPGALAVLLAAITVNSPLGLTGTLALMLSGQIIFGIAADFFGWFGITKGHFSWLDSIAITLIFLGCLILIKG